MKLLRRVKQALPYAAAGCIVVCAASLTIVAPMRSGGGLAAAVEQALKD